MKNLPTTFLFFNHEGLFKAHLTIDPVLDIDKLLARLSTERLLVIPGLAKHPFGVQHLAIWTSEPPRLMPILELQRGVMTLSTMYHSVTQTVANPNLANNLSKYQREELGPPLPEVEETITQTWVSPCFMGVEDSFTLRCAFDFSLWSQAGLRLFLGLSQATHQIFFWVFYADQIYRPPLGNIFDSSAQLCLGKNEAAHRAIFFLAQSNQALAFEKAIQLMSDSTWNQDTFHSSDIPIINKLIRFDSDNNLPMLPPIDPELIKRCSVVTNKDLIQITAKLIPSYD